jgi:toxin ParE1/3/4
VATSFLERIARTMDMVRQSPLMGPSREQLGEGLRVMFQYPYAMYYQVTNHDLIIVRVLHGARDTAAIAEQGGFLH